MTADPRPDAAGHAAAAFLLGLMVLWALALPLTPRAAAAGGWRSAGAAAAYGAGSLVCHQRPERSFAAAGHRWPVCARCAGIYLSAGVAAALALAGAGRSRLVRLGQARLRLLLAAAVVPVAATWALERAGVAVLSNVIRAASGVPLGAVVAAIVASALGRLAGRPGNLR